MGGYPKYEGDGTVELSVRTPQGARESMQSIPLPILDFLTKKVRISSKKYRYFMILSFSEILRTYVRSPRL